MSDPHVEKMLKFIKTCQNSDDLKRIAKNARAKNVPALERAASLRLYEVLPSSDPGTFEFDVWKSHAPKMLCRPKEVKPHGCSAPAIASRITANEQPSLR